MPNVTFPPIFPAGHDAIKWANAILICHQFPEDGLCYERERQMLPKHMNSIECDAMMEETDSVILE